MQSIKIEESWSTIDKFLEIVTTGDFTLGHWNENSTCTVLVELSHLAKFLHKYDCPVALSILRNKIRDQQDVPLIAMLLVEIPDEPRCFVQKLDTFKGDENRLWVPPSSHPASFKPNTVPVRAFAELPIQYHWALKQAKVGCIGPSPMPLGNGQHQYATPGRRFEILLKRSKLEGFGP